MVLDAISESRLAEVHPELAQRVRNLASQLDFNLRVTAGIRTVAQQNALYERGRTTPGPTVTNAKGTESNHIVGYAVDFVVMDANGEPDWNNAAAYDRVIALAPSCGLRSGAGWGDRDHLELDNVPRVPSEETQQVYRDAGVQAVWADANIASA